MSDASADAVEDSSSDSPAFDAVVDEEDAPVERRGAGILHEVAPRVKAAFLIVSGAADPEFVGLQEWLASWLPGPMSLTATSFGIVAVVFYKYQYVVAGRSCAEAGAGAVQTWHESLIRNHRRAHIVGWLHYNCVRFCYFVDGLHALNQDDLPGNPSIWAPIWARQLSHAEFGGAPSTLGVGAPSPEKESEDASSSQSQKLGAKAQLPLMVVPLCERMATKADLIPRFDFICRIGKELRSLGTLPEAPSLFPP